jgi:hypothetical protein
MSQKMAERKRAIVVNIAILLGLTWCYFRGYPTKITVGSGIFLLAFANI